MNGADVLEHLDASDAARMLVRLSRTDAADGLEEMDPDDAADVVDELPQDHAEAILVEMQAEDAEEVRTLLAYPPESAASLMTREVVTVAPNLTADQALAAIRRVAGEAETIYFVYVTDAEEHLLGVLSLRELVLAPPNASIGDITNRQPLTVRAEDDQEATARLLSDHSLLAVPVLDADGRLLGIVTADDAGEVLEEEATEDVEKLGRSEPLQALPAHVDAGARMEARALAARALRRGSVYGQRLGRIRGRARRRRGAGVFHSAAYRDWRQHRYSDHHRHHTRVSNRRRAFQRCAPSLSQRVRCRGGAGRHHGTCDIHPRLDPRRWTAGRTRRGDHSLVHRALVGNRGERAARRTPAPEVTQLWSRVRSSRPSSTAPGWSSTSSLGAGSCISAGLFILRRP
jgi:CBS domain-containing protein